MEAAETQTQIAAQAARQADRGTPAQSTSTPNARFAATPDPLVIVITGHDFRWNMVYPGLDGIPGTDDDVHSQRDLRVPVAKRVRLELHSKDFIYTLALPHLDLKEIAIPDMTFSLEFEASATGSYELLGDQLCGYSHPNLMGKLVVESQHDFIAWTMNSRPL